MIRTATGPLLVALVLGLSATAFAAEPLRYEPSVVTLSGTLVSTKGAEPEEVPSPFPALRLNAPIDVVGTPGDDLNSESVSGISLLQLVLNDKQMHVFKRLKGKRVVATGTLFHAHTAHHYTDVLLTVQTLRPK